MGKGVPDSYGSSRGAHASKSHPESHIDVMHYDQDGNEDKSQRQHIPSSFWSWFKPSGGGGEKTSGSGGMWDD